MRVYKKDILEKIAKAYDVKVFHDQVSAYDKVNGMFEAFAYFWDMKGYSEVDFSSKSKTILIDRSYIKNYDVFLSLQNQINTLKEKIEDLETLKQKSF